MFITLCIIAYNEENSISNLLDDFIHQDYDHSKIEVLLVDGKSTDATKRIMLEFAKKNREETGPVHFRDVRVVDNPKRILPAGWNVALASYHGEAILKVDAHASIPADFVGKNVELLESGEDVTGGLRPNIIDEATPWKETLLLAESSMFGSSIAPYRNNPGKSYVKSMFHAAYRRKVFDTVGGFNENLARTEDNEIHYRIRKAGFKLCFSPEIISYQHTRSSLKKMLKQKYANGYWIGLTTGVCRKCLSIYHFVPFAFVIAIILSTILCLLFQALQYDPTQLTGVVYILRQGIFMLTEIMWGAYWVIAVLMAVIAVIGAGKNRNITCISLPILFFMLHISYGIGTLIGMIKMPFWVKGIENGRDEER